MDEVNRKDGGETEREERRRGREGGRKGIKGEKKRWDTKKVKGLYWNERCIYTETNTSISFLTDDARRSLHCISTFCTW